MVATRHDFTLEKSSDTDFSIQVYQDDAHTAIQDISGYTAIMTVRSMRDATGSALLTLTSSPAAGLTVNGPAGQVAVHIAKSVVSAITWLNGQYDVVITSGDTTIHKDIAYGNVSVRVGVTL